MRCTTESIDRRHYFGIRIDGQLGVFSGSVPDGEFANLTSNGLPSGWVAWHLEPGEDVGNSERVRSIRDLPLVVEDRGALRLFHKPAGATCVVSRYPIANLLTWLRKSV